MDPKRAIIFLAVLVLILALLSWLPRGATTTPQSATAPTSNQPFNAAASRGKDAADFNYLVAHGIPRKIAQAAVKNPRIMDAVMAEIAERRHSGQ
jgi:hypothetical protein